MSISIGRTEIRGKVYEIREQTEAEKNAVRSACAGCVAEANVPLCDRLGNACLKVGIVWGAK